MKHDAIYARYSSHAQDDGTSIEVQIEQCERAAGGTCRHYIDRAKSGRATANRTELLAMLAEAEAGRIGRVFVYKFDRLGRDAETHVIARTLEESGVELISATEGTNALARGIQLVVAEDYSRQLGIRTHHGLMKRFEQGGFTGGVTPFGYSVVDRDGRRVLEVNEAEAGIVREVAGWYVNEATGLKNIARRLRERGLQSRRGAGWNFNTVRSLLLNPVLTGRIRFNVRRMHLNRAKARRLARMRTQAEQLERQDEGLRILDDATFNAVAERMKASRRGGTRPAPRGMAPFTGLVYCQCGAKCHRVKSQNAKGCYYYYLCSRKTRFGDCPFGGRVREDVLMEQVKQRFERLPRLEKHIIARALELATAAVKNNRGEAERIKADLAEVEAEQDRGLELLMDRDLTATTKAKVNRMMAETEGRRDELQRALDRLREQATVDTENLARDIHEAFETARENLAAAATPEQFNRLVEDFVGPIVVTPDGPSIKAKTPPAGAEGVSFENVAGGRINTKRIVQAGIWCERVAA